MISGLRRVLYVSSSEGKKQRIKESFVMLLVCVFVCVCVCVCVFVCVHFCIIGKVKYASDGVPFFFSFQIV